MTRFRGGPCLVIRLRSGKPLAQAIEARPSRILAGCKLDDKSQGLLVDRSSPNHRTRLNAAAFNSYCLSYADATLLQVV